MKEQQFVADSILIEAPIAKVWDALVNPEQTKKYMFGCAVTSDFQLGGKVDWVGSMEGKEMVFVTGVLMAYEPEKVFSYTTFDPNRDMENVPENHVTVTCTLSEEGGKTRLEATQGDFAKVADGQARYEETLAGGGWTKVLQAIKALVEA